jgi:glycosyltransferase involved in cell wall biosynthesis
MTRVRFIVKEHSGGPATRNRCIAQAKGEFLLWVDSDDIILPKALETYIATLRRNPEVDVLYGNLQVARKAIHYASLRAAVVARNSNGRLPVFEHSAWRITESLSAAMCRTSPLACGSWTSRALRKPRQNAQ